MYSGIEKGLDTNMLATYKEFTTLRRSMATYFSIYYIWILDTIIIYIYIIVMSLRVCLRDKTERGARMRACDTSLEPSRQKKSIHGKNHASCAPRAAARENVFRLLHKPP